MTRIPPQKAKSRREPALCWCWGWLAAHLERNGKSRSIIVLDGGDLRVKSIRWNGQSDATICIEGGITNSFRNQVTLVAAESSVRVRNHLDEHCGDVGSASAPSR